MADVVVSYSREDQALVDPIAERLKALGLDVRCSSDSDQENAVAEALETEIEASGALLVCWSHHAVASSSVRAKADVGLARQKLVACRLTPCDVSSSFDAVDTGDLRDWDGRADSPEWEKIVAAIAEKLRRPALLELAKARISGDDGALCSFARRFPDEPQARRIWAAWEARHREEFASVVRDARRSLEQRVADQRTKIENALKSFDDDFEVWLERERRGETSPKPTLSTLFEIWLEQGGRGRAARADNGQSVATTAETEAQELQQRLESKTTQAAELRRRLEAAELSEIEREARFDEERKRAGEAAETMLDRAERAEAALAKSRAEVEALNARGNSDGSKKSVRSRNVLAGAAISAFAFGALVWAIFEFGHEPSRESVASADSTRMSAPPKNHPRLPVVDRALRAGDDVSKAPLETREDGAALARPVEVASDDVVRASARKAPGLAAGEALRASVSQAMVPVANLPTQDLVRELVANMSAEKLSQLIAQISAASPDASSAASPEAMNAILNGPHRREVVSLVTRTAPSDALSELLANQRDEVLGRTLQSDRQTLLARLIELAPEEVARALASKAPALAVGEALKASAPQATAPFAQLPPRDLFNALEADLSSPKLSELGKLIRAHTASYRTYDNWDVESRDISKSRTADLQNCASACRQKESCKAYTYDKWNRVCYLKSDIGEFKLNPRSSSGVRDDVRVPKAPSGEITMERYPSKAFPGSGYKAVEVEEADACEQICKTEEACVAYTFHMDERTCRLFNSTGEYFTNNLADSGGKRQE